MYARARALREFLAAPLHLGRRQTAHGGLDTGDVQGVEQAVSTASGRAAEGSTSERVFTNR